MRRPAIAVAAISLYATCLCGCGRLPADVRKAALQTANDYPDMAKRNAHVEKLSFRPRTEKGEWPFEGEVLDRQGKRLGVVRGRYVKNEFGSMVVVDRPEWDEPQSGPRQ